MTKEALKHNTRFGLTSPGALSIRDVTIYNNMYNNMLYKMNNDLMIDARIEPLIKVDMVLIYNGILHIELKCEIG